MTIVLKDKLQWTERGRQLADKAEDVFAQLRKEDGFKGLTHQDFYFIMVTSLNDYAMIERLGWHEQEEPSSKEPEQVQ